MTDKQIYQIGLTMINGVGDILARHLLQTLGDAEAVFAEKQRLLEKVPGIGSTIAAEIKRPEILQRAEKELAFIGKNHISCYFLTDTNYPVQPQGMPGRSHTFLFQGKYKPRRNSHHQYRRHTQCDRIRTHADRIPDKGSGQGDPGSAGCQRTGLRHRHLRPPERFA